MALEHMGTADTDPFATSDQLPDEERLITGGRYRLPELIIGEDGSISTGGKKVGGRQRVTTLVKAIGDSRALDLWHQRQLILGMVMRPDLYDLSCATVATNLEDSAGLKKALDELAPRILAAAGADAGAALGTAFHGFTEAEDLGLASFSRPVWRGKLNNYREGLAEQRLEVIPEYVERIVVVEEYDLAGTLDRILLDQESGELLISDLKSQKTFWTWLEIAAQLAAYSLADAMWDRRKREFVEMPKVSQDEALVAWMPKEHPLWLETEIEADQHGVDFFRVDLERGGAALKLCKQVDRMRSEAKSKRQTWGLLRPAPHLGRVEAFARRLDSVSSAREGSALWAEIAKAGLAGERALSSLAGEVAMRFKPQA